MTRRNPPRSGGNAQTVAEFENVWMDRCPRGEVSTINHNRQMVRPLLALYGHRRLGAITDLDARRFAREHPSSIRYAKTFFSDAVKQGLLVVSPFDGVPGVRSDGRAGLIPPTDRQILLAAHAAGPAFADVVLFAGFAGARIMEIAHLDAAGVHGHRCRVRTKGTGERWRTFAALGPAADVLARRVPDVGLVFTTPFGRRWSRSSVCRAWGSVRAAAGLPTSDPAYGFHCLRHACATRLLNAGHSEQDVATQLGHFDKHGRPSVEQLRRTYGHPDNELALRRLEGGTS